MDKSRFYASVLLTFVLFPSYCVYAQHAYTVIDANQYHQVVLASRLKVQRLLVALSPYRQQSHNEQLKWIIQQLADTPYLYHGAMGEGDWQGKSTLYKPGAPHLQQDPVYRLDGFDCQTFVQVALALLYSKDVDSFDQTILKIAYGAAGNPAGEVVHFYNRNHFVDADLNPINQKNGYFADVTSQGPLARFTQTTSAMLTRQKWFAFKNGNSKYDSASTVHVLDGTQGDKMVRRLHSYRIMNIPKFNFQKVIMTYLPKHMLAMETSPGKFRPNDVLLNQIPTPAVIEMVYNHKNWNFDGTNIKDIIGTELNIAHFGLLYRQSFHQGELIYHKINCNHQINGQKRCEVTPIYCQRAQCQELMFAHATDGYPKGFYWYKKQTGNYTCSPKPPGRALLIQYCNRVEQKPFFDYLTEKQFGTHRYMHNTAFIGVHIEKLLSGNS